MKFYTHEEMLDKVIGERGSSARERFDKKMDDFLIGEAIRRTREANNLTQEQLGELMGVKRAQISKIESGKSRSKCSRCIAMNKHHIRFFFFQYTVKSVKYRSRYRIKCLSFFHNI